MYVRMIIRSRKYWGFLVGDGYSCQCDVDTFLKFCYLKILDNKSSKCIPSLGVSIGPEFAKTCMDCCAIELMCFMIWSHIISVLAYL